MTQKTYLISIIAVGVLVNIALFLTTVYPNMVAGAEFPSQFNRQEAYASSTTYTLTWGRSTSIVGTSTSESATPLLPQTSSRTALTFQTVNCQGGGEVWLRFNDVAAATTTGYWLTGSTTATFGDDVPMVAGAIKALASAGNCTLLVSEWRSR